MSLYIVDIHGDIEGDYEIVRKYEEKEHESKDCSDCKIVQTCVGAGIRSTSRALSILDKIYADIQRLRGCSCSCSDGIIDDIEDILDKYKAESEE